MLINDQYVPGVELVHEGDRYRILVTGRHTLMALDNLLRWGRARATLTHHGKTYKLFVEERVECGPVREEECAYYEVEFRDEWQEMQSVSERKGSRAEIL